MSGRYEQAITVEAAIKSIVQREYLLPAIQRKFEWGSDQICVMFDSIMRGYPAQTATFDRKTDARIWAQQTEMSIREGKRFSLETNIDVYFCDPRSPWQRGSNENTNRLDTIELLSSVSGNLLYLFTVKYPSNCSILFNLISL